ncbi:hypothetical protein V8E53_011421, partial [Lactarius tabidus]
MVNIHLNVDGPPLLFLTIPNDDVLRLSIRPYKWIRYVLFSICGARGYLSTAPNGQSVDYDSTSLSDDIDLYYNPSELCLFVDYQGLNDNVTSSDRTPRGHTFRDNIIARDGVCIVSRHVARHCDAAHLVPRSKGNAYINKVTRDRSPLYGSQPPISDINAVENGVLLEAVLHRRLGTGEVALLKPEALLPLPPAILDYVYGVAAYRMWRSDKKRVHDVMATYHREQYADIRPRTLLSRTSSTASQDDGMAQAMDDLNLFLMRVSGINPQDLADKWEKQMEEEERVAQEKSRSRVMEWRSTGSTFSTSDFSSNSAEQVAQEKSRSNVTESRRIGSTFATSGLSSNAAYKVLPLG